jgi:outer membrane protein insertion porin family
LCDAIGSRITSSPGYSIVYDKRNNRLRPTRGYSLSLSQDFAGLGGEVKYISTRLSADKYLPLVGQFVLALRAEGGYIKSLEKTRLDSDGNPIDPLRLTDRFHQPQDILRGFDIRGVGPRVTRTYLVQATEGPNTGKFVVPGTNGTPPLDRNSTSTVDDELGGRAYYFGRAEIEIPLGAGARELGLRPSIYMDVGSFFGLKRPQTTVFPDADGDGFPDPLFRDILDGNGNVQFVVPDTQIEAGTVTLCPVGVGDPCTGTFVNQRFQSATPPFAERYFRSTWKPRLSIGFGVNWNSPFGPFRIDIAKALLKQAGDDTKLISFNVGTQF